MGVDSTRRETTLFYLKSYAFFLEKDFVFLKLSCPLRGGRQISSEARVREPYQRTKSGHRNASWETLMWSRNITTAISIWWLSTTATILRWRICISFYRSLICIPGWRHNLTKVPSPLINILRNSVEVCSFSSVAAISLPKKNKNLIEKQPFV